MKNFLLLHINLMVTFKNDIQHWIYSSDKHDASKDIITLESLKDKLKQVT